MNDGRPSPFERGTHVDTGLPPPEVVRGWGDAPAPANFIDIPAVIEALGPSQLPWWKSKVIIGAAISIVCKLLVMFGLVGEIAPGDQQQLADVLVLVLGGIGDLVAIGARLKQKHAPPIVAGSVSGSSAAAGFALGLVMFGGLLTGCAGMVVRPPVEVGQVADKVVVESARGLILANLAYRTAGTAAAIGMEQGLITGTTKEKVKQTSQTVVDALQKAEGAVTKVDRATAVNDAFEAIDLLCTLSPAIQRACVINGQGGAK